MPNSYYDHILESYEQSKREDQLRACLTMQKIMDRISMPTVELVRHTHPHTRENMESWLYRTAEENALKSASELAAALKLPAGKPLSRKRHHQLSSSIGSSRDALSNIVPTVINSTTVELGQHRLPRKHLALTTSRLCPHCVTEYGYGKLHWNISALAVCEEHGVYLIDHCECSPESKLGTTRPRYHICHCGKDLKTMPTQVATPEAQVLSIEIVRLFQGVQQGSPESRNSIFAHLPNETSLTDLLKLVIFLGAAHSDYQAMSLGRAVVRMRPVIAQFEQAAHALSNWPNGIFNLFRQIRAPFNKKMTSAAIYKSLLHVSRAAEKQLPPHIHQWFLEALGLFLASPQAWVEPTSSRRK